MTLAPLLLLAPLLAKPTPDAEFGWQDAARPPVVETLDEFIMGPPDAIDGCEGWLEDAGVRYKPSQIPVHTNRTGIVCGAPQVVRYRSGPGAIAWKGQPRVTCGLALGMARLEVIIQEEAKRHLGTTVARIEHLGTYNCREMAAYPGWVSEHSYGNGIDLRRFILKTGKVIEVKGHYGDGVSETRDPMVRFVRAVAQRAIDENVFSVVITPAFDRLHHNHVHVDMARYRVDGTR